MSVATDVPEILFWTWSKNEDIYWEKLTVILFSP